MSINRRWVLVLAAAMFGFLLFFQRKWFSSTPQAEVRTASKTKGENQGFNRCPQACQSRTVDLKFYSQSGEDKALLTKYFSNPAVCNGTYLEIGALDGTRYSNTKFFEDSMGWIGILIEAQPENYLKLKKNRPKSITHGVAICPEGQKTVKFSGEGAVGGQLDQMSEHHKKSYVTHSPVIEVPCIPMRRILKNAAVKKIDIFSLDVEGAELTVLETMDWAVPVRTFVIEVGHGDEKDESVRTILKKHGYVQAEWDIRDFCPPKGDCAPNEVWENKNQAQFIDKCQPKQYLVF